MCRSPSEYFSSSSSSTARFPIISLFVRLDYCKRVREENAPRVIYYDEKLSRFVWEKSKKEKKRFSAFSLLLLLAVVWILVSRNVETIFFFFFVIYFVFTNLVIVGVPRGSCCVRELNGLFVFFFVLFGFFRVRFTVKKKKKEISRRVFLYGFFFYKKKKTGYYKTRSWGGVP